MGIITPFYTVPDATEALIITGGIGSRKPENPFKVIVGRGAFWIPLIHRVKSFYIGSHSVPVSLSAQTAQNIDIDVRANIVFRVIPSKEGIRDAASRFLDEDRDEVEKIAQEIFAGEARAIIGTMSVQDIIKDRMRFTAEVISATQPSMLQLGWQVDSFQISSITDKRGHIENLSKPELVRVQKEADIAQAKAEAEVEDKRQEAARQKSEYQKETDIKVSENTIETAQKRAEAEQSEPISRAEQEKILAMKMSELAIERAQQRENELVAEVIKPAQAEAEKKKLNAQAEAESIKVVSDATASNSGIELQRILIQDVLPKAFENLGEALSSADLRFYGTSQEGVQSIGNMMMSALEMQDVFKNVKPKTEN